MHTLNDIIANMKALIATHDATAERNEQAAAQHEVAAAESRRLAAEARSNADALAVALARIEVPPPAPAPSGFAAVTEAMAGVSAAMGSIAGAPVDDENASHLPKPGGRWIKRAETFEADNREGVWWLRALMGGGLVNVSDAVAMSPPTDRKHTNLAAWIFREGWIRENRPTGAVYRPMTPGSKQHTNWLACAGRLA